MVSLSFLALACVFSLQVGATPSLRRQKKLPEPKLPGLQVLTASVQPRYPQYPHPPGPPGWEFSFCYE